MCVMIETIPMPFEWHIECRTRALEFETFEHLIRGIQNLHSSNVTSKNISNISKLIQSLSMIDSAYLSASNLMLNWFGKDYG